MKMTLIRAIAVLGLLASTAAAHASSGPALFAWW